MPFSALCRLYHGRNMSETVKSNLVPAEVSPSFSILGPMVQSRSETFQNTIRFQTFQYYTALLSASDVLQSKTISERVEVGLNGDLNTFIIHRFLAIVAV